MFPIRVKSTFHNVGQGLFYTAQISKDSSGFFRLVYDCGGNKDYISASIRRYLGSYNSRKNNKKKLDMLIISHLHVDHVSGINELLKQISYVDYVVLPYLTPFERLLLLLQIDLRRIRGKGNSWYVSFLKDPVDYFIRNFGEKIEKIILVGGGGGEGKESEEPDDLPPEEPPSGELLSNDDDLIKPYIDDKYWKSLDDFAEDVKSSENWGRFASKLTFKEHKGRVPIYIKKYPLWILSFFNYKVSLESLSKFEECIKDFLKRNQIGSVKDIFNIFLERSKKTRGELIEDLKKNCYHECFKKDLKLKNENKSDINNTSLMLYHGPIVKGICKYWKLCYPFFWKYYPWPVYYKIFGMGQLLTGDISLKMSYQQIISHYRKYLSDVVLFQVPHHGSIKNWDSAILEELENCDLWVISAGCKNRYGHPSCEVIHDICNNSKIPVWVNECHPFTISCRIDYP